MIFNVLKRSPVIGLHLVMRTDNMWAATERIRLAVAGFMNVPTGEVLLVRPAISEADAALSPGTLLPDKMVVPPTSEILAYLATENPFWTRAMAPPNHWALRRMSQLTARVMEPTGFNKVEVRPRPTYTRAYVCAVEQSLNPEHIGLAYLALRDWDYPQQIAARLALAMWREGWRPNQLGSQAFYAALAPDHVHPCHTQCL